MALPLVEPFLAGLFAMVATIGYRFVVTDRDKRFLRKSFALYLAPSVIEKMVSSNKPPELGGETRLVTVYFWRATAQLNIANAVCRMARVGGPAIAGDGTTVPEPLDIAFKVVVVRLAHGLQIGRIQDASAAFTFALHTARLPTQMLAPETLPTRGTVHQVKLRANAHRSPIDQVIVDHLAQALDLVLVAKPDRTLHRQCHGGALALHPDGDQITDGRLDDLPDARVDIV